MHQRRTRSVLILAAILVVATLFRFGGLGAKPLWLDEAMTALLCLGRGPADVPLGVARPLSSVNAIFAIDPGATWRDVATRLVDPAIQHTHPPLFYVLSHAWLSWWRPSLSELAWALRAVAATFGVVAVALTFGLTRAAFGVRVALIAAAIAAVSPAMVVIAQEARNYTLPLTLIAAAQWAMLAIVKRVAGHAPVPRGLWASWAVLNALACYAHYYGTLAFTAQFATLAIFIVRARSVGQLGRLVASTAAAGVAFLPWASALLAHSVSIEQRWMRLRDPSSIFYNTLEAWQAMILGKRWEVPLRSVADASQAFALVFGVWLLAIVGVGLVRRFRAEPPQPAALALLLVVVITLVEFFVLAIGFGKNLLLRDRYHFAYYPPWAALLAWAVANLPSRPAAAWREKLVEPARWVALSSILLVGGVNAALTDIDLESRKEMRPDRVGAALAETTSAPVLVVIGTGSFHETVATLTYLIELSKRSPAVEQTRFAFVLRANRYATFARHFSPSIFWAGVAGVRGIARPPSTLWIDGLGLRVSEYRRGLEVRADDGERRSCALDRRELTRPNEDEGEDDDDVWRPPFRLYRCEPAAD